MISGVFMLLSFNNLSTERISKRKSPDRSRGELNIEPGATPGIATMLFFVYKGTRFFTEYADTQSKFCG